MKRISAFSISIILLAVLYSAKAQDTIPFVRKIKIGADLFGPAYYLADRNNLTAEGFISVDIDTSRSLVIEGGYADFKYSRYNYDYFSKGMFVRIGADFNTMQPEIAAGRYYAGISLRYGLSIFKAGVPFLKYENYWGTVTGSLPDATYAAHFAELSPGIRAELFRNFIIGWSVRLRFLIYSGTGKNFRAVYIPGYGNGTKSLSPGINYYLIWSIPMNKGK
jgi:hypothetical protein